MSSPLLRQINEFLLKFRLRGRPSHDCLYPEGFHYLTPQSGRSAAERSRDSINLQGSTIALIDDEPAILDSMRLLLEAHDANVLTFQSGGDFLRASPQSHCLVVDYHLPEMNGLALIAELRRHGDQRPAIIITALNDPTLEQRAAAWGVRKVLHKPIGPQALICEVRTLIGNRGSVAD